MTTNPSNAYPRQTRLLWPALALLVAFYAAVLIRWPDNFFADDSYFYFQVAFNFARGFGSTFNGLMLTNGYHPLWMLVCAAIFKITASKSAAVHLIAAVIALLNFGTLLRLTVLLNKAGTAFPFVAWLLYLPFCFTTQLGTEGALSGFFLAATLLCAYKLALTPSTQQALIYALCAAFAVLSRLDNIFIITFLTLALILGSEPGHRRIVLRKLFFASPIAFLLWAVYLFTNHHGFGTWQPISGVLKSHSRGEHRLFTNLPHIALLDLAVIAAALAITHRLRRDLFHHVIELPFAAGVLLHALYIVFIMSSETRWSWYYTTWTLLAGILLARSVSVLADGTAHARSAATPAATSATAAATPHTTPVLNSAPLPALNPIPDTAADPDRKPLFQLTALAAVIILLLYFFISDLHHFAHNNPDAQDPGFQANVVERSGLHTLLAFDKPGRIAYYSTARIVPLDGLMGNLRFQQDLASQGIAAFDRTAHVDGFIGPPQPLDEAGKRNFCDQVFLSSAKFHCVPAGPGHYTVDRVDIFARLTNTPAGFLPLPPEHMVWNAPGYVAAWRITPLK